MEQVLCQCQSHGPTTTTNKECVLNLWLQMTRHLAGPPLFESLQLAQVRVKKWGPETTWIEICTLGTVQSRHEKCMLVFGWLLCPAGLSNINQSINSITSAFQNPRAIYIYTPVNCHPGHQGIKWLEAQMGKQQGYQDPARGRFLMQL